MIRNIMDEWARKEMQRVAEPENKAKKSPEDWTTIDDLLEGLGLGELIMLSSVDLSGCLL